MQIKITPIWPARHQLARRIKANRPSDRLERVNQVIHMYIPAYSLCFSRQSDAIAIAAIADAVDPDLLAGPYHQAVGAVIAML